MRNGKRTVAFGNGSSAAAGKGPPRAGAVELVSGMIPRVRHNHVSPCAKSMRNLVSAETLMQHCETKLTPYKVPVEIIVQQGDLPRNASGKLLKREIAQSLRTAKEGLR